MATNYQPSPIVAEHVELCDELLDLVEMLAENAHDVWAQQRIADGWTFGMSRCDEHKLHPCIVPYSDLPESEKVYDRNAVLGTVQAIIAVGFNIQRVAEVTG